MEGGGGGGGSMMIVHVTKASPRDARCLFCACVFAGVFCQSVSRIKRLKNPSVQHIVPPNTS